VSASAAAVHTARGLRAVRLPPSRAALTRRPRPALRVRVRREAAAIANQVLQALIARLVPGALIADACEFGDALIEKFTGEVYKTKKIEKGIAFPTCISVNECVGHYSPLKSESRSLAEGDSVKM
jgi:methionine aminopeptidase